MKKIIILLTFISVPVVSFASSISLSPITAKIYNGDSQKISIVVNPQTDKIYTTKVEIKYSTDLFEIKNFTFSDGVMPLSQTGYDLLDNSSGILIKTAGFPGGLSDSKILATFYLVPKKIGDGNISVTNNSFNLDATNKNTITNVYNYSFNVIEKPITKTTKNTSSVNSKNTIDNIISTTSTSSSENNLATVYNACNSCERLLNVLIAIITLMVGFFIGRKTKLLDNLFSKK